MKFTSLLIAILCFSVSCNSSKKATKAPSSSYAVLFEGTQGGKETKSYEVINEDADFKNVLQDIGVAENSSKAKSAVVDFDQKQVVALHMGKRNTGGYNIGIESVEVQGDTTWVSIKKTAPKPNENVTMALTAPYCVAVVDKNKHILFKE